MSSDNARDNLVSGNIVKTMISLSIPAILGMVVIGLYNFMDAVFVGRMVGPEAMTAVKVSYPFTLLNSGISTLIGTGSASVLSRAIGKKDQATVDKIMGNLIALVVILSAVIMAVGLIFTKPLLLLSRAKGDILVEADRYLKVVFLGSLFVNFAQSSNMVMRGEGKLKKAMLIMGSGAILNIILDPILITVFGKENGIIGAAVATVSAQLFQAVWALIYFTKKSDTVKIGRIGIVGEVAKPVFSVGVSAMLMQVMTMLQQTVMYNTVERCGGGEWQTILAAALSLQAFSFIPLWGISQGYQPAIGTNYGAREFGRVRSFNKAFMIEATLLAALFYLPVMLAPKAMLSMFITDTAIVEMGAPMLRVMFASYITYGVLILVITFFQAIGKGGNAAILTILRQVLLFLPLVLILPLIFTNSVAGVFFAQLFTDAVVLLIAVVLMVRAFRDISREENIKVVYDKAS
ncbi:MAG: MATE family efflux transporter [Butyrivibrio sp.]|nr:MATE family efflux transporter [Butyrivibrio sp.]MBE5830590.1 MATE family efflux transporter [Butyrivibrio sp.]